MAEGLFALNIISAAFTVATGLLTYFTKGALLQDVAEEDQREKWLSATKVDLDGIEKTEDEAVIELGDLYARQTSESVEDVGSIEYTHNSLLSDTSFVTPSDDLKGVTYDPKSDESSKDEDNIGLSKESSVSTQKGKDLDGKDTRLQGFAKVSGRRVSYMGSSKVSSKHRLSG